MAFHWLSCDNLSLAGLLLGNKKISLPSAGSKVISSCWECKILLFLWVCRAARSGTVWAFPFWHLDPVLNEVSFVPFHKLYFLCFFISTFLCYYINESIIWYAKALYRISIWHKLLFWRSYLWKHWVPIFWNRAKMKRNGKIKRGDIIHSVKRLLK